MAQPKSKIPQDQRLTNAERLEVLDAAFDGLTHGEISELLYQWDPDLVAKMARTSDGSWKGKLQTFCARRKYSAPEYVTREEGTVGKPLFCTIARITLDSNVVRVSEECTASKKKISEENAAELLYNKLMDE